MSAKLLISVLLCSLLWGCGDYDLVRKEIQYKDMRVSWYDRELGDNLRAFVKVSKGYREQIVMNCASMMITDINIVEASIVIKMHEYTERAVYDLRNSAFGIPVRIDPWATQNEFNKIYNPKFYHPGER